MLLILSETLFLIGVALIACEVVVSRRRRAAQDARCDVICEQASGAPLRTEEVLRAAQLILEESLTGSPARSAASGQDAVSRPFDAWVDDTLLHLLDEL
jgi:hypothetical protein